MININKKHFNAYENWVLRKLIIYGRFLESSYRKQILVGSWSKLAKMFNEAQEGLFQYTSQRHQFTSPVINQQCLIHSLQKYYWRGWRKASYRSRRQKHLLWSAELLNILHSSLICSTFDCHLFFLIITQLSFPWEGKCLYS